MELLHIEAEGSIIRHFDRFMNNFLVPAWAVLSPTTNIWKQMDSICRDYYRANHMDSLPYFCDYDHWKFAFSGENKLRFFVHCPSFLVHFIDDRIDGIEEKWNCIKLHSSIVERLCRFRISKQELQILKEDFASLHRQLLDLYPGIATLNTHYETHLVEVILR